MVFEGVHQIWQHWEHYRLATSFSGLLPQAMASIVSEDLQMWSESKMERFNLCFYLNSDIFMNHHPPFTFSGGDEDISNCIFPEELANGPDTVGV